LSEKKQEGLRAGLGELKAGLKKCEDFVSAASNIIQPYSCDDSAEKGKSQESKKDHSQKESQKNKVQKTENAAKESAKRPLDAPKNKELEKNCTTSLLDEIDSPRPEKTDQTEKKSATLVPTETKENKPIEKKKVDCQNATPSGARKRSIEAAFWDKSALDDSWGYESESDRFICFWCGQNNKSEKVLLLHLDDMKCNTVFEKTKPEPTRSQPEVQPEVQPEAKNANSSLEDLEDKSSQSGHKCMICQVPPFDNAAALVEHVRVKHTVRCKYCGDKSESFPSRGYLMKHQQEVHPQVWKKIQEKKMRKKMEQSAAT